MLYEGTTQIVSTINLLDVGGGKSHHLPWNPPPPPSSEAGLFANSSFGSTSSSSSKEDSSGCVFRLPSYRLVACCLVNVCFRLSPEAPAASDSVELVFLSLVSGGGSGVVVMLDNLLILSTVPRVGGELC